MPRHALVEARRPKQARQRVQPAMNQATRQTRDAANDLANRIARELDAIFRRRWMEFLRAKKPDAAILTDGLERELDAATAKALADMANEASRTTLEGVAKSVPGEALLAIHSPKDLVVRESLTEAGGPILAQFVSGLGKGAQRIANSFLRLPTKAEVARLVFEPFEGQTWTQRMRNWLPVEEEIATEIQDGLALGKSRQEIARAILPLVDDSRYKAIRIARTEVHRVNVTAQMRSVDQALGDAVVAWRYTATRDSRVSEDHLKLDGKVYKRGETKPRLPSRPNCRCVYSPVMKSWDSFGLPPAVAAALKAPFGGRAKGV